MRNNRNLTTKQAKKGYAFVVDGKCESWYIQMLKKHSPNIRIAIKPELPQKKNLDELYKKVIELSEDYEKVFWIIDMDVLIKENREAKKQPASIDKLKEYWRIIDRNYPNVIMIVNNPCFEYWLLLHFERTSKYYETCAQLHIQLKKHQLLANYHKTEEFYIRQSPDIYKRLEPLLNVAVQNAKLLPARDFDNYCVGMSQMHLIFDAIY